MCGQIGFGNTGKLLHALFSDLKSEQFFRIAVADIPHGFQHAGIHRHTDTAAGNAAAETLHHTFRQVKPVRILVAANMANCLKEGLQQFMTSYRTEKNKLELNHSIAMCDTAFTKYMEAQKIYAEYVDKHQGLSRQIYKVEEERLAGEMQLAFNIYNTLYQQKLLNEAELQRRTPVFTVLQNASVPVKPASSKKLVKTFIMAMLSALVYLVKLVVKDNRNNKGENK